MRRYEPYKFDSLRELMERAYRMGWYPGRHDLLKITITMQGAFEGWSGQATERWEQHFYIQFTQPAGPDVELEPQEEYHSDGVTLDEACRGILAQLARKAA